MYSLIQTREENAENRSKGRLEASHTSPAWV